MKAIELLASRAGLVTSALLLLAALAIGWLLWPDAFFHGYWFGLMYWTQLIVGALIVLLMLQLTGGRWGVAAAPMTRALIPGFFFLLPFFVPVLFALGHLFPWMQIRAGLSSPALVLKQPWLNPGAFTLRTVLYLGALAVIIACWRRLPAPPPAGPVLVAIILLMSFFSSDWMMSLQPTFYSSMYPFIYFSGAMVSIFAVLAGTAAFWQLRGWMPRNPDLLLALGKLLFAAVFFWGYIMFCQFIIIWTGNLPDEAEWYVLRAEPAWLWLTVLLSVGHFAVPFSLLLSQRIKRDPRRLLAISAGLMVMHLAEVFWLMRPTPGLGLAITPFDFLMPVLIGAGCVSFVLQTPEARGCLQLLNKEFHA